MPMRRASRVHARAARRRRTRTSWRRARAFAPYTNANFHGPFKKHVRH